MIINQDLEVRGFRDAFTRVHMEKGIIDIDKFKWNTQKSVGPKNLNQYQLSLMNEMIKKPELKNYQIINYAKEMLKNKKYIKSFDDLTDEQWDQMVKTIKSAWTAGWNFGLHSDYVEFNKEYGSRGIDFIEEEINKYSSHGQNQMAIGQEVAETTFEGVEVDPDPEPEEKIIKGKKWKMVRPKPNKQPAEYARPKDGWGFYSKKDAWEAVLDGELGHDIITIGTWKEVKKQTLKWLKQLKNGYINKKNPHDNKKIDPKAKEQDGYAIEDLKLYDEEKRWTFHFDHGKHPYDLIIQPVGYKESANNWRHGDCHLFAIKAHKDTGWPIYKISEKPNSHAWHFFVMNPETGEALDGAGYRSAEEILQEHDPDFNPEYEGLGTYPEIYKSSLEEAQNYRQGYKESKWKISVNKENNFDETIKYTMKKIKRHLPSFLFGMGEDEGINQRIKIQENLENDSKFDEYYVNNSRFYNPEQLTIYHSKIDETEKERRFSNSLHYYILDNLDEIELNYPTDSWGEIVDNIFEVFDADMKQWWKEYDQGFNLGFTQGPRNFYINQ